MEQRLVLVAGVGNRLMGDDGFGPRVIDALSSLNIPEYIELRDAGTAGITIATDLEDYDMVIFIDSMEMEGEPGKLKKARVENIEKLEGMDELAGMTLHEAGLEGLLRFSKTIGTLPSTVYLIGCKPDSTAPSLELSPIVENVIKTAVNMVLEILEKELGKVLD